jgi:hypothetical protein
LALAPAPSHWSTHVGEVCLAPALQGRVLPNLCLSCGDRRAPKSSFYSDLVVDSIIRLHRIARLGDVANTRLGNLLDCSSIGNVMIPRP